jgi:hypothetical protein
VAITVRMTENQAVRLYKLVKEIPSLRGVSQGLESSLSHLEIQAYIEKNKHIDCHHCAVAADSKGQCNTLEELVKHVQDIHGYGYNSGLNQIKAWYVPRILLEVK